MLEGFTLVSQENIHISELWGCQEMPTSPALAALPHESSAVLTGMGLTMSLLSHRPWKVGPVVVTSALFHGGEDFSATSSGGALRHVQQLPSPFAR